MKKLNNILNNIKKGSVITSSYFSENNISPQLLNKYIKSNWFKSIGTGAYLRYSDSIDFYGAIYSIQSQLNKSIYIGGKTSLILQGITHFVSVNGLKNIDLKGLGYVKLPKWFDDYNWNLNINYEHCNLFDENMDKLDFCFVNKKIIDFDLIISSPERALLEMLDKIPEKESFEEAYKIMELLYTLRPDILNNLLQKCNSIKTKRIFLFLAENINHSWFEYVDISKINLGTGNRLIEKNGELNKKYMITVPKGLFKNEI